MLFDQDPYEQLHAASLESENADVNDTAPIVPCYKSERLVGAIIEAALAAGFPASSIFIIINGDSPTSLDNTEEVCKKYNVCHFWSSIGSKIVAQYVGYYVARLFHIFS